MGSAYRHGLPLRVYFGRTANQPSTLSHSKVRGQAKRDCSGIRFYVTVVLDVPEIV